MLRIFPSRLSSDLASASTSLRSAVAMIRREIARQESALHDYTVQTQALLLTARHTIADLDRLIDILDSEDPDCA